MMRLPHSGRGPSEPVSVDIVLLLPRALECRAIAASAALGSAIRLGRRACPHVTLAMACVDRGALPALRRWLRTAATRPAIDLEIAGTRTLPGSRHSAAWYEIERTPALLALHREAMRAVAPHRRRGVPRTSLALRAGDRVGASTRRWIDRFREEAAFSRYRPHVTLGYGKPADDPSLPRSVRARRLALFQLGNHCTCARRLAEARLR